MTDGEQRRADRLAANTTAHQARYPQCEECERIRERQLAKRNRQASYDRAGFPR